MRDITIAVYVDHEAPVDHVDLAGRCIASARKHMPDARILHLTTIEGPVILDAMRMEFDVQGTFPYRRATIQSMIEGEMLFVDCDIVFMHDVRDVFEMNFEIAMAKHHNPRHPWLAYVGGAVFSRKSKFWKELASITQYVEWRRDVGGSWLPMQLAFNWLTTMPEHKVMALPQGIYEYQPRLAGDPLDNVRILHMAAPVPQDRLPARPRMTEAYKQQLITLHKEGDRGMEFGVAAPYWAPLVEKLASELVTSSILDYGAGPGALAKALPELSIREYDPAIEGKDAEPEPADLVVCTDVLEHIEPECIDAVLDHLRALTRRMALLAIYIGPAQKRLPDGRNAHLIQLAPSWWIDQINRRWAILRVELIDNHLAIIANGDKHE